MKQILEYWQQLRDSKAISVFVKHWASLCTLIGTTALIGTFTCPCAERWIPFVGFFALLYCIHYFWRWFFTPIKRDLLLVKGPFLYAVCAFVLFMPFAFTFGFYSYSKFCSAPNKPFVAQDFLAGDSPQTVHVCLKKSPTLDITMGDTASVNPDHIFWPIYYHFLDQGNQHNAGTARGRNWVALFAALGILLFNGLLVSTLINWFEQRKERWQNGEIRYKTSLWGILGLQRNRFAVIIGANEIAASVIKNLQTKPKKGDINFKCEGNNQYIILQTCRNAQEVRDELAAHLTEKELDKVIIYKARRDSKEEIEKLYLVHTTEIYILGEPSGETFHDAMNMQCVNLMAASLQEVKRKKVCKVLFEYQTTYSVFQFSDISDAVKKSLVFIPFNRYESWARTVIVNNQAIADCASTKTISYTPLDGNDGIEKSDDKFVHFIIVGMSKMGIAMGIQALLQCHYLNFKKQRSRITFIDAHADDEFAFFKGRYENLFKLIRHRYIDVSQRVPFISTFNDIKWEDPIADHTQWHHLTGDKKNFLDVEIEIVNGKIESEGVRNYLRYAASIPNSKQTIAICLTQTHQAIAASLYMPIEVYKNPALQDVWVYQPDSEDIIYNLHSNNLRYVKLKPFGMVYGEYMSDRKLYLKSLFVNASYDLDKIENIDLNNKATYKNPRESWKLLDFDKKWSNKYYADSMHLKVQSAIISNINFDDPILGECEHNRWNIQQLIMGYSPCDSKLDKEFEQLNKDCSTEKAKKELAQWKKEHDWDGLPPIQLAELKKHPEYLKCPKGIFDTTKEKYKTGEERIHPNICAYEHLNKVDSGAQQYDKNLNEKIPVILALVDKPENTNTKDNVQTTAN